MFVWRAFALCFASYILYSHKHRNTVFLVEHNSLWETHSSCNPFRCSQYLNTGKSVILKRDFLSYSWLCCIFPILLLLHLKVNWGLKIKIAKCRFMCCECIWNLCWSITEGRGPFFRYKYWLPFKIFLFYLHLWNQVGTPWKVFRNVSFHEITNTNKTDIFLMFTEWLVSINYRE